MTPSLMLAFRLESKRVIVIGAGEVAAGRVQLALDAKADVVVIAPQLGHALTLRHHREEFTWWPRAWEPGDEADAAMVLVAVDDPEVGPEVAARCRAQKIPVNVADVIPLCDFWFPSVHRDGPVQIAVSTNGTGPALARRIRERIARALPHDLGDALTRFGALRTAVRQADPAPQSSTRRMAWLTSVAETFSWRRLAALSETGIQGLVEAYQRYLPPKPQATASSGRIRLVGAGPGDPGLLTVAAAQALAEADVVFADRLVPDAILDQVKGEVRIVRRPPGQAQAAQHTLDAAVLHEVRAGRDVVRLKSGDPNVFGRAAEELAAYRALGIEGEVIAGVSSALAGPAAAGISPTLRGVADRVLIATAAGKNGTVPRLPAFAPDLTVVLLMGIGRLPRLSDELNGLEWPSTWPAAIVERATQPDSHTTWTTVGDLSETTGVVSPAVIILGRVVGAAQSSELARLAVA